MLTRRAPRGGRCSEFLDYDCKATSHYLEYDCLLCPKGRAVIASPISSQDLPLIEGLHFIRALIEWPNVIDRADPRPKTHNPELCVIR